MKVISAQYSFIGNTDWSGWKSDILGPSEQNFALGTSGGLLWTFINF